MFEVVELNIFKKIISKWDNSVSEAVEKIIKELIINPYSGKPLGYYFLREKKIKGFRIYYIIYADLKRVLLVQASTKKNQEVIIEFIKNHFSEYRAFAESITS